MSPEGNIIGTSEEVTFPQFNKSIVAKVDTGATTCCLHASNIKVDRGSRKVSFTCPEVSGNVITLPLVSVVEVHSADHGGDPRPVVELDIVFAGQQFSKVQFNLNDRSDMDSKVLIGENLLKQGNFAVKVAEQEEKNVPVDAALADKNQDIDPIVKSVVVNPYTMECIIKLDISKFIQK